MAATRRLLLLLALCSGVAAFTPNQVLYGTAGRERAPRLWGKKSWESSDLLLPSPPEADEGSKKSKANESKPSSQRRSTGTGLAVVSEERGGRVSQSSALAPFRGSKPPARRDVKVRTADLFVPPGTLAVMVEWAEKLEAHMAAGSSLIRPDKEQRLLMLAQVLRRLEQRRLELSEGQPSGSISMAEVAESFDMRPSDVETYYRLGLRARSYILMSMHDLIVGLASRYAAQYRMQQQELVQEGYRAVLKAIDKYDANKAAISGATFQTFAFPYIVNEMVSSARAELGLPSTRATVSDEAGGAVRPILLPPSSPIAALPPGKMELVGDDEVLDVDEIDDDEEEDDDDDEEEGRSRAGGRGGMAGLARMRKHRGRRPAPRRVMAEPEGESEHAVTSASARDALFGVDPEQAKTPGELMEEEQQTRDLSDFLSRAAKEMSEQDMQVLALSYGLNGDKPMKRTQVAEKLGLKVAAVSRSKDRAIRKLREMLELDSRR